MTTSVFEEGMLMHCFVYRCLWMSVAPFTHVRCVVRLSAVDTAYVGTRMLIAAFTAFDARIAAKVSQIVLTFVVTSAPSTPISASIFAANVAKDSATRGITRLIYVFAHRADWPQGRRYRLSLW